MITDDVRNKEIALNDGLKSFNLVDYVREMKDYPDLLDKINRKGDDSGKDKNKSILFPEHLSQSQISAGIKSGRYKQGVFYLSRTNFLEGSVNIEGREPVLLHGLESMNRAVDGDTVAVEILEKKDWSAPAEVVLVDEGFDPGDTLETDNKKLKNAAKGKDVQCSGKVVGIIKRKWRQYCGMLQPNPNKGATKHLFVAAEKKIPKVELTQFVILLSLLQSRSE